ncbi:unnamed protein product [Mytilus edulis]|uniref:Uncharacterized protein n=1 Tax=Mytilus edulis TaxID=6550 RepID=A0A8S3R5J1_MYTED|nr:unnamed protein product [Mytilus edulis]
MTDTDLHKFLIIRYGDIHEAKRHFTTKVQNVKKNQRTEGLFHKFRKKFGRKVKHDKSSDSDHNVSEEDVEDFNPSESFVQDPMHVLLEYIIPMSEISVAKFVIPSEEEIPEYWPDEGMSCELPMYKDDKDIDMLTHNLAADIQAIYCMPRDGLALFSSMLPVYVVGDGKCLPRSDCVACFGNETAHKDI